MKKQCTEYEFLIVLLIDGESEEADKREVFLHLAECESCRAFWETATEMKLQAAREIRQVAPATLDKRVKTGITRKNSSLSIPHFWGNLVHRRIFSLAPVAVLLALMQRRLSVPVPVASVIGLLLVVGTLIFSSLAFRMQEPKTVFIMTLPGIEVEARNP
jgi:anti-sigma factor RsiW